MLRANVRGMDFFSWLLWPVFTLAVFFLTLTLVIGAVSVWPSRWSEKLYAAGEIEIARRYQQVRTVSQADHLAAQRLLGPKPKPEESESDRVILDAVAIMTDAADRSVLAKRLERRRDRLATTALRRQVSLVANVSSLTVASHLWSFLRGVNAFHFALNGLAWFLPRTIPYLVKIHGKHLVGATIGGIFLGILVAGFSLVGSDKAAATDWEAIVSNAVLLVTLAVMATATFELFALFLVTSFGEVRQWTAKGIGVGIFMLTFAGTMCYLNFSGKLSHWQQSATLAMLNIDLGKQATTFVGSLMTLVLLGYVIRNLWTWIRARTVVLSDRILTVACLLLLVLISACYVLFTLDTVFGMHVPYLNPLLLYGMSAVGLVGMASGFVSAIEWIQKYRAIASAGWVVKRKGFRWWGLITWIASILLLQASWPLVGPLGAFADNVVMDQIISALYDLLVFAAVLAAWPGVIVTVLYIRRVNVTYRELRHREAPEHPLLTDS